MKIAVVDDSPNALFWAVKHLQPLGAEVVTYDSSLGIHFFVGTEQPDILLLDVRMPALKGDYICKMLKENRRTQHIPIALYSSMPEDELAKLAKKARADGYICKTDDPENLWRQIHKVLNRGPPAAL